MGFESGARREDRRRFFIAGAIAAGLAILAFLLVLLDGHPTLFHLGEPPTDLSGQLGQFYDAQAHSLLQGHWQVPSHIMGIEGFHMDDGTYMYFGPWPAVLRMPVAALTSSFDNRLTQVSMLLAYIVALTFTVRLAWRVRSMTMGDAPVSLLEAGTVGAFVFVVGTGSVLMYLAGSLVVFQEALFWGVAWAIGAFEQVIAYTATLRARYLVFASLLTLLALYSRAALGAGPLIALGLLLLVALLGRGRGVFGIADGRGLRRLAVPLLVAVLIPAAAYIGLNMLKFGTPFSLPFDRQLAAIFSDTHRGVLNRNGGSLVGLQFVPTTVFQYFRPDSLQLTGSFPWVTFPDPATIIGSVRFDQVMPASSATTSMPLLTILGLVGLVGVAWGARTRVRNLAPMRAPVLGAAAACVVTVAFGFIAQRYLADFVPLLVLLGLAGLYLLISWTRARPRATWVKVAWGGAAVLAALSIWISTGLTIVWQKGWDQSIIQRDTFPTRTGDLGSALIIGHCDGLFRSSGSEWRALELTAKTGWFRERVTFPAQPARGLQPLVVSGRRGSGQSVYVGYVGEGKYLFGALIQGHGGLRRGRAVAIDTAKPHRLDIQIDPLVPQISVRLDGLRVFQYIPDSPGVVSAVRDVTVGRNDIGGPIGPVFSGEMTEIPFNTPECYHYTQVMARLNRRG